MKIQIVGSAVCSCVQTAILLVALLLQPQFVLAQSVEGLSFNLTKTRLRKQRITSAVIRISSVSADQLTLQLEISADSAAALRRHPKRSQVVEKEILGTFSAIKMTLLNA